jgi:hypothetical protein
MSRYFGRLINITSSSAVPGFFINLQQDFTGAQAIAKAEMFASLLIARIDSHE